MRAPALTDEEAEALCDELALALDELRSTTCFDMVPLWLDATREPRKLLAPQAIPELGFTPSPRYLRLSKGARSKYRGLAAWRHAVIWRRVRPRIEDPDHRDALEAVYFTPYASNEPPYAWSSSAAKAPAVGRFGSATTLKHWAKDGCWHSVALLRRERRQLEVGRWADGVRAHLLKPATRDTLRDELKLEDHDAWEQER
jgi:hypothetical protein